MSTASAGVAVKDTGFMAVDVQIRTNVPNIVAIGDMVCQIDPAIEMGADAVDIVRPSTRIPR